MDMRKLISFSKGSYVVSMPKSWVQRNQLKKGDLMAVSENGSELVIAPNNMGQQKDIESEITINATGKDMDHLKAEIVSSYLNNYNTINIISENLNEDAAKIKEIIRNLSGLEIMEQSTKRITAKDLININDISIRNIIKRMDMITRAMIDDSMLAAKGHDTYDVLHSRDVDVNRLYFLAHRVIKNAMKNPKVLKAIGTEPWKLLCDKMVLVRIEAIADTQKRIARYLKYANLGREAQTELERLHFMMAQKFADVMKAYYTTDVKLAMEIEVTNKDRIKLLDKFLEKHTNTPLGKDLKSKYSSQVAIAKTMENLKIMANSIKYISRIVMGYE